MGNIIQYHRRVYRFFKLCAQVVQIYRVSTKLVYPERGGLIEALQRHYQQKCGTLRSLLSEQITHVSI